MSFSIQTNVNALTAQENLRVNSDFQGKTIQRLTSGYRINSSADDAAGLSIANQLRSDTSELSQGVRNANDGVSQLQIVDGGLSNISKMLDRMKTLATQSASTTFNGNRSTVNTEYQQLVSEITRQAADVGLNTGGDLNKKLSVYIGGARTSTQSGSSTVDVDLSTQAVDASALKVAGTSVTGATAGVDMGLGGASKRLDDASAKYLAASGRTQTYSFNYVDSAGAVQSKDVQLVGSTTGISGDEAIAALNTGLSGTGITAGIETSGTNIGQLTFSGSVAFTVTAATPSSGTDGVSAAASKENIAQYTLTTAPTFAAFASGVTSTETFTVSDGTHSADVTLDESNARTQDAAIIAINDALKNATGGAVNVVALKDGSKISFQSAKNFTVVESAYDVGDGAGALFGATGNKAVTAADTSASAGTNAIAAIDAINKAVSTIGTVQGTVGAGQNKLGYAINLAQSQISNFSAAESRIRDADVAAEAANLTKAQVLQQASIAAMAQANSAPQAVMALLRG